MFDVKQAVLAAEKRITPFIRKTPLDFSPTFSRLTQAEVYLKCENLQYTGSFKVRGALNKLLSLSTAQRKQGVVTASSGNHGAALAFGLKKLKIPGLVFLPENASTTKINNIRQYEVPIEFYANDCMETEMHARAYAAKNNLTYISPYNDLEIISGQGTLALELSQTLPKIDLVLVPVGGGGLISGIAGYLKAVSPQTQIMGCLPANSPVMAESIKAGQIVEIATQPTLSDATAGGIEPGALTFEFCTQWVDNYLIVSEEEIKEALLHFLETQPMLVEGAAGLALAALPKIAPFFKGKNIVVILSGANLSLATLKTLLNSTP
jgi:threonine dehydratase